MGSEMCIRDRWEALCDGCAKCCLLKIVDKKKVFITNISCSKLEPGSCRCSDYLNREKNVKACLKITKDNLHKSFKLLPSSCSYKLIAEGKTLPLDWCKPNHVLANSRLKKESKACQLWNGHGGARLSLTNSTGGAHKTDVCPCNRRDVCCRVRTDVCC